MTQEQWSMGWMRSLAVMFNGQTLGEADEMGEALVDDTFLILLNSYGENVTYTLPASPQGRGWKLLMNTHDLEKPFDEQRMTAALEVAGRSVVLLRELAPEEADQPESRIEEIGELVEAGAQAKAPEPSAEVPEPILAN